MSDLSDGEALARLESQIDGWLAAFAADNEVVCAVGRDDGEALRWFVRMAGEDKALITVWITLGQRTLRYETHVLPGPETNAAEVFEQLLRRNDQLVGVHFSIGAGDAVFLRGELPTGALSADELDRAIGTVYATVELVFKSLLRLGFAGRFTG